MCRQGPHDLEDALNITTNQAANQAAAEASLFHLGVGKSQPEPMLKTEPVAAISQPNNEMMAQIVQLQKHRTSYDSYCKARGSK